MAYRAELFGYDADDETDIPLSYADIRIMPPIDVGLETLSYEFQDHEVKSVLSTKVATIIQLDVFGSCIHSQLDKDYPMGEVLSSNFPGYQDHETRMKYAAYNIVEFIDKLNSYDDPADTSWASGEEIELLTRQSEGQ